MSDSSPPKTTSQVTVNTNKNCLYITFSGSMNKQDIENVYQNARKHVSTLKPGFTVINDMSKIRLGHLSGAHAFMNISNLLSENQVGRVIRIVGKKSLVFKQISKLSKSINGYKPEYVSSLQEAEEQLNSK